MSRTDAPTELAHDVPPFEGSMVFTSSEDDHVSPFTLAHFEELNGDDPMLRVWSEQLRALEPGDEVEIAWFTFRRVHQGVDKVESFEDRG